MRQTPAGREHLPFMGVGPLYVGLILALTAAAIILAKTGSLPTANAGAFRLPLAIVGVLIILAGTGLWAAAFFGAKIDRGIAENCLVTGGVYAHARNPIYSAFLFLCSGALLIAGNLWLLVLPVAYWLFLTLLMKATEEKWLLRQYGQVYRDYCRRVPRCIPRLKKHR
ncbi:methyltransferase [Oscillibacter sp.]|uniref:methyltransferase family protein n=1 Tax=Oscillibacter sp. TaxID=1945593 RepID=UPI0033976EB4